MKKYLFLIPTLCALCVGCQNVGAQKNNDAECVSDNRNQPMSDNDITAQVRNAIKQDSALSITTRNNITVTTSNGVVTLEGAVMRRNEIPLILKDVQSVGVRRMVNKLTVIPSPKNVQ